MLSKGVPYGNPFFFEPQRGGCSLPYCQSVASQSSYVTAKRYKAQATSAASRTTGSVWGLLTEC